MSAKGSDNAVVYVRQSLDKTGERAAVERQERECRELAQRNGWVVKVVYSDNDKSASRGVRPAWRELLGEVRAGRVRVVIAWHTDRLYRRMRDTLDLLDAGKPHGLKIVTVRAGELDLSTPAGRMIAQQLAVMADYEVEQKGDRQRAANLQRARRGEIGWTRRPYGYDKRDGRVVTVPAEAAILRDAARRVLDGETVASIVTDLKRRGIPSGGARHGCEDATECTRSAQECPHAIRESRWTQTALTRLLLSPRHAGRAVSNGVDYGAGQWSAIFDAETAERLRVKLTDPRRRTAPASVATKYLLSGLLTCGKCGAKMYASPASTPNGRRWMIYRCMAKQHLGRRLDLVDQVVDALVVARMSQPDAARLLESDLDVAELRSRASELRDRRGALAALLADGLMSPADVRTQAERIGAELADVERRIEQADGSSPFAAMIGAPDVAATWQAMSLQARRETIRVLFESLTVLPVTKGARFHPSQVAYEWQSSASANENPRPVV